MAKAEHYRSKVREEIVAYLARRQADFLTVKELADGLEQAGVQTSLATIYRTLALLEEDSRVVKIPAAEGQKARYRYVAGEKDSPYGRLQCQTCGQSFSLNCRQLDDLIDHIESDHNFAVSRQHILFYGLCPACQTQSGAGARKLTSPKFWAVLLIFALLWSLLLLSPAAPAGLVRADDRLQVVASNFPAYDFLRQVGGDRLDLTLLIQPGAETHSYEPSPRDLIKVAEADLFVYTGGAGDAWVESILETRGEDRPSLAMVDMVELLDEEVVEGMEKLDHDHEHEHEHEHDHEEDRDTRKGEEATDHDYEQDHKHEHDHEHNHGEEEEESSEKGSRRFSHAIDEHIWTSPQNAAKISQALSEALIDLDPEHAEYYQERTNQYLMELADLDQAFKDLVEQAPRHTIVVGDRFPLRYFVEAYGLEYYAAFPGCSTQGDASPQTLTFLIDKVRAEDLPVVFHIELSNQKLARTIAEDTGAEVLLFHGVHNVSKEDFEAGLTYLDFMEQNLQALAKALND